MAKICPVCKRSYGDEHSHCPHCAARQAGDSGIDLAADLPPSQDSSDSGLSLGSASQRQAGDSGLDLAADLPPSQEGSSSGESLGSGINWNDVGDEASPEPPAAAPPPSPPPAGKAPVPGGKQTMLAPDDDIMNDPVHPLPQPPGAGSSSVIDLGQYGPADEAGQQAGADAPQKGSDSDLLSHIPVEEPPPGALPPAPSDILAELAHSPPPPEEVAASPDDELVGELFAGDEVSLSGPHPSSHKGHDKPEDSAIDLGALSQARSHAPAGSPQQEEELFVAELASDVGHVDLVSEVPPSGSKPQSAAEVLPVEEPEVFEAEEVEAVAEPEVVEAVEAAPEEPEIVAEAEEAEPVEAEEETHAEDIFAVPEMAEHSSRVDLSQPDIHPEAELPLEPVEASPASRRQSEVDLGGLDIPATSHPDLPAPEGSSVDLGAHPEAHEPFAGSSAQPVAADSNINIGRRDKPPAAPADSGLALDIFLSQSSKSSQAPSAADIDDTADVDDDDEVVLESPREPGTRDSGREAAAVAEAEDSLFAGEDEPAVADEEEPVVAADEEEAAAAAVEPAEQEARPKPPRPRSRVPAFVGGGVLGLLAGVGAWAGLVLGGLDPAPRLQELTGKTPATSVSKSPQGQGTGGPSVPAAPSLQDQMAWVQSGDYQKAREAGYEQAQASNPQELARRGEYRWLTYLQAQRQARKPVQLADPAVKAAQEDLQNASKEVPEALYWLGHISEVGNDPNTARKYYSQGLQQFNDPIEKVRFQAAIDRLDLQGGQRNQGAFLIPADRRQLVQLVLILVALQQPAGQQAPGQQAPGEQAPPGQQQPAGQQQAASEEAGGSFWQALRQARAQNYEAAIKAIDTARKIHDDRRYVRLRKAQNPLTDPTEEIFLRACDELHAYWQLLDKLKEGGYLAKGATPEQTLTAISQQIKQGKAAEKELQALAGQLVQAKAIDAPEKASAGVTQLLSDREKQAKKIADLQNDVKKSKDDASQLQEKLTRTEQDLKSEHDKLVEASQREKALVKAREQAEKTLRTVADQLTDAHYLEARAAMADVPQGVQKALAMAAVVDPMGLIRKLQSETAEDKAELRKRRTPEEMLSIWLPVLQTQRQRKDLADDALEDVDRVLDDPRADAVERGKALLLRGLALRNAEKFDQARPLIQQARQQLAAEKGAWLAQADAALVEVSHPETHYLQRVDTLYNQGRLEDALDALNALLPRVPRDEGRLLARRSLLRLEIAGLKSERLRASDPAIVAASKDAAAAVSKGAAAAGHFAAGRIAEEMGQYATAGQRYRQAIEAHPTVDATGSEYRIALARVLLEQQNARAPAAPAPVPQTPQLPRPQAPAEDRTPADEEPQPPKKPISRNSTSPSARTLKVSWTPPAERPTAEVQTLALLSVLALQAPDMAVPGSPDEADRLADEVLRAPADAVPFHVRAQALVIKGRWTAALQVYAAGLRPYLPRAYAQGLQRLILNHPRLRQPEVVRTPSPYEAEQRFSSGLTYYFNRDYDNAELEFTAAVENYNRDARYFYFLGLARLAQGKREYIEDFEQGALLERQNRPPSGVINATLERVQGPYRYRLNQVRQQPR